MNNLQSYNTTQSKIKVDILLINLIGLTFQANGGVDEGVKYYAECIT